ncbi:DNA topoisomerase III [Dehalobacterium formicoaceticum]|uniref:DNA topoisomerase III n=1 Tax=Dehalobacterium formicoaceticum TaxID=51515 RepID=UPI0031F5F1C9
MKKLVLAEKPSVAREIARVLKCTHKNKGFIEGPDYVVTWALGHLVTLAEPEDYHDKYKEWRLEDLPMIPGRMKLKVIRQTSHQYQTVKKLMKRNDISELVIATDAGREGELVARWIMVLADWKKPFSRLWISSQTDAAIREGFAHLKPGKDYNKLYDAAVARAEADWLVGLNVTRALTCKFNAQLNAGRVQTPTLSMIVQREEEINNFRPVDYWTIRADFGSFFGDWRDSSGQSRIFNLAQGEEILARIQNQTGTIKEVKTEKKSEPAPLAYDLTELQRDANRRFGWAAQKTLSVLQNLYEQHKLVSYPRTDSRYITSDMAPTLPARLKGMAAGSYLSLVQPLLGKTLSLTKRFVDNSKVTDHHAIIPTEQPLNLAALSHDEKNLYDLIAKRFISLLYPPYRYEQITLVTEVKGEKFYAKGRRVIDQGWRAVSAPSKEKDEVSDDQVPEQSLDLFKKGETKQVKKVLLKRAKTKPPARYNEATLLTAMENPGKFIEDEELRETMKGSGLGTPATRAEIIEKLLHTSYIERHGKELVPTSKGKQLIKLVAPDLRSPELTAKWEQQLSDIAQGKGKKESFISDIQANTEHLVKEIANDEESVYKADNISKTKCPMCGKYMLLVNGKRGRMLSCPDRGCGYRQPEKQEEFGNFRSSKKASMVNQKLINTYSDKEDVGTSLGDLLKEAMAKKK